MLRSIDETVPIGPISIVTISQIVTNYYLFRW